MRALRHVPVFALAALVAAGLSLVGCEGATTRVDRRYATPERTVHTLLEAYGLDALSQDAIRGRMAARERFVLRDRAAYEGCFDDLRGSTGEGMAGWVLGALAAGRDDLRTEMAADRASVSPREGVRIVMRHVDGAWRIVLRDSVPREVQRGLAQVAARAEEQLRRRGPEGAR